MRCTMSLAHRGTAWVSSGPWGPCDFTKAAEFPGGAGVSEACVQSVVTSWGHRHGEGVREADSAASGRQGRGGGPRRRLGKRAPPRAPRDPLATGRECAASGWLVSTQAPRWRIYLTFKVSIYV